MSPRPAPSRRPRLRAGLVALALIAVGTAQLAVPLSAQAAATAVTSLTSEGFTGGRTAETGWFRPSATSNYGCLTAGTDTTQLPIPGCSLAPVDRGVGTLRLTDNGGNKVGTVYSTSSLPTTQGLDVRFSTYQWKGSTTPADGINFILAATDPTNPAPPASTGPVGGSLGYSAAAAKGTTAAAPGVANGYLGFGLDVYGNYRSSQYGGTGCGPTTSAAPQNVTVRGPGNGNAGYCIAGTQQVPAGTALDAPAAKSRPASVPVEVALNPLSSPTTSIGGVPVPAKSWLFAYTPVGGSQQTMSGLLPTATALASFGFPASYYDPSTGLPYQLTFGWAASTGGSNEIHEINSLTSSTLNGQLPDLDLALGDSQGATFLAGSSATVSVTPSLDATQGPERRPVTVTTTFPVGLTPTNPTTSDYVCSTAGQVVSCTYTTVPLSAGQPLPTVSIPVQVGTAAASGLTITVKASSTDANPAQATRAVSVVGFGAKATPARVAYGTAATLSATGLPADATGTVAFTSGASTLCTVTLPSTSCSAPEFLTPATYPVTATYTGDPGYASRTATTSFEVTRLTPVLTAWASDTEVAYGTQGALASSGLPAEATGSVTFTSGGTTLCVVDDVTESTGCSTPTRLEVAVYPVTATYSGDARFAPTTASTSFSVVKASVDLRAAVSQDTVPYGSGDTLSAGGLPADATGDVRFTAADGSLLCAIDDVAATTSCQVPAALGTGTYDVTAAYAGDGHHPRAQASTSFAVVKADTALVAAVSDPSVPFGTSSALSFSGLPPGATGTVTFTSDGGTLCSVDVTDARSCASPTGWGTGTHAVLATYSGDDNHHGSSDPTQVLVTAKGSPDFTAAASDPRPTYGTTDTLAFSGVVAGATGSVTFTAGGRTLCTVDDVTTSSSCATAADLDVAAYDVTATYSGDDDHVSTSASASFRVVQADTALDAAVADDPLAYGLAQTLSFGGLPRAATGSVVFSVGSRVLCEVADVTAAGSCTSDGLLDAGAYGVTVRYSGDDNHRGSSAATSFSVQKAATDLTAGVSDAEVPYGTAETLTFSGLSDAAGGTVTFSSRDRVLCAVDDVRTSVSCGAPGGLAVGPYPVTASYSGDPDHSAATATTSFAVARAATSLSASVERPSVPWSTAESVTFGGLPAGATGSVTFAVGDVVLCTVADVTVATSCSGGADLPTGVRRVTATYSGDDSFAGSRTSTAFAVVRAQPPFSAGVTSGAVVRGSADTLTFSGLPAQATGSVRFTSGARTLCTVADVTVASSCATAADLAVGGYPVVATYGGDVRFLSVTAATGFTVTPAPTLLSASVSLPEVHWGEDETFRFDGLPVGATGRVTFAAGDVVLCTVEAVVALSGSCDATVRLPVGPHAVTATYSGDTHHQPATATTGVDVHSAATSLSASVERDEVPWGASETLRFDDLSVGATGSVTFDVDGRVLCTVEEAVSPSGSCDATVDLAVGPHEVTATYSGDRNHDVAFATTGFVVVRATTRLSASVDLPEVAPGSDETFRFGDLPAGATGSVTFTAGGVALCTVEDVVVPSGSCEATVDLPVGSHEVTASYSGDANHQPSEATTTVDVVRLVVSGFTAAVDPSRTPYGTPVVLSFAGLPSGAEGTVRFSIDDPTIGARVDEQLLCTVVVGDADSCRTPASLEPGVYPVLATYSGDSTHDPATARLELTVVAAEDSGGGGGGDGSGSGSVGGASASNDPASSSHTSSLAATGGPGVAGLALGLLLLGAGLALVRRRRT
ncbi:MAG: Ig-like domain repeat protein [Janthinobacterium lividum]